MSVSIPPELNDRRREERRTEMRLSDLSLPEFRRILITLLLSATVLALFFVMVGPVLVGGILGLVIAAYLRPLYRLVLRFVKSRAAAATLTLTMVIVPVLGAVVYSYFELVDVIQYVAANRDEVASRIDAAVRRLPFLEGTNSSDSIRDGVLRVSNYGMSIPGAIQEGIGEFSISAAVFLFTAFYVFTEAGSIVHYIRGKVPARYSELQEKLVTNVRGVLYGAIYATLLTQTMKTAVIFLLNLVFGVPLAGVLAILSFIIGFFPIVGSWSVYVPVAAWLLVFRNNVVGAVLMLLVGFLLNTLFISMYLRPKIAAERSHVLNFYWMFVGLVTGVYTFGLAGILLGPILIGLLKAVIDTVTETSSWRLLGVGDDSDAAEAGA